MPIESESARVDLQEEVTDRFAELVKFCEKNPDAKACLTPIFEAMKAFARNAKENPDHVA
ncbi:hypothetical protein HY627_01755 [Candidatus Uhrbacteria bacterium]|nr:hypothetical protein [Candidatus Uhrbacteria bacterium]